MSAGTSDQGVLAERRGHVRLADFIARNAESILAEWVTFAATCGPAGETMNLAGLRDHAMAMLKTIIVDLGTAQSDMEQAEKSRGHAKHGSEEGAYTPAEEHGAGRAELGFTIGEMVSEYRALRASVIRLWAKANGSLTGPDLDDLTRFNEAIDQALAESTARYAQDIDQSKEMFVAILGHDLRTPIGAVIGSSQFMLEMGDLNERDRTLTAAMARSAQRMNQMVGDLLDLTRSRFGSGIPIKRQGMDISAVARHAVDEMVAAAPQRLLEFQASGDLYGQWDAARIGQVLTNLLANAVQHGAVETPISMTVRGEATDVVLRVHNRGPVIPASRLDGLFNPLKRLRSGESTAYDSGSLGLGLYIAERIVSAHGGTIDVSSSVDDGTAFTVRLPR
jgi:signal transduction histidine kinase